MADNVYTGGVPTGGFDSMMSGAGFGVSKEAESSTVPGGPAPRPGVVKDGGATPSKTYDKNASQDFLMEGSYKSGMEVAGRPTNMKVVNPNDLSSTDHC